MSYIRRGAVLFFLALLSISYGQIIFHPGSSDTSPVINGNQGGNAAPTFNYYVSQSTGLDTNPGTISQPFQTISKVHGLALTAGQSVGFMRGDTWREMFQPPSSGSAGNRITFGAYGAGADPIISGADALSGTWTQARVTQFADTLNHNGTNGSWTKTGTGTNFASGQFQMVMAAATGTHRITFAYNASPPTEIWCTYQLLIPSGFTIPNNTGGLSSGLFNASTGGTEGSVGFHNTSGTLFWEGDYNDSGFAVSTTAITTDVTHTVLIHLVTAASGGGSFAYWVDGVQVANVTGLTNNVNLPTEALLGMNFTGATMTVSADYSNFAIYSGTDSANVWQTALTTQPHMLVFNGTDLGPGGLAGVPASYNPDKSWFWSGNVIYLSSTSIPSSRFTSLESGVRNSAIDSAGKSHIVIDGLSLQKSNGIINGAVTVGASSDWVIRNSELAYSANAGVYLTSVAGGSLLISNNSIHDNAFGVLSFQYTGGALGTEAVISGNTISDNTYTSFGTTWGFPEGVQMYGNYFIVENNTVSNNGNTSGDSIGIHIYDDDGSTSYGKNNIVRFNVVSGEVSNGSDGSAIEIDHGSQDNLVYGNVAFGNHGPCIDMFGVFDNEIYQNTCYNNFQNPSFHITKGEIILSSSGSSTASSNNLVKNNIFYATQSGTYALAVGSDTVSNGNVFENNLLYDTGQANWYFWGASGGSNLATFNALPDVTANLNSDPDFVSAGTNNFNLQSGSPAINAGVCITGVTPCPTNIGAK